MDGKKYTSVIGTFVLLLCLAGFAACNGNHDYAPKPRGYFRIVFPKKAYRQFDSICPFTFVYPVYARVVPDTKPDAEPCWLNMQFPQFGATVHISYEHIKSPKELDELVEDAHKLSFKHTIKASSIDQGIITYPDWKVYGIYYTIDGTKNYVRGALYFNTEPRQDSIQPVLTFVKKDVDLMIKSFRWK
jgi:gliding motility-associated lipoprotein GldD